MNEVLMPSIDPDETAVVLLQWLVKPGDVVHRCDEVAYIETNKGVIPVESFADGVVESLLHTPGERVPVGAPLVRLDPLPS